MMRRIIFTAFSLFFLFLLSLFLRFHHGLFTLCRHHYGDYYLKIITKGIGSSTAAAHRSQQR
jgi:hypothetical protein